MKNVMLALTTLVLLLSTAAATADQKEDVGPYEIHYSVIPSGTLTPDVAQQYNITRSKAIGLVSISVLKKNDNGMTEPVSALVEGQAINDIRQFRPLNFRQVKEGKATYYLAQFQFAEGERLEYRANVHPLGHNRPYAIRFSQELFND